MRGHNSGTAGDGESPSTWDPRVKILVEIPGQRQQKGCTNQIAAFSAAEVIDQPSRNSSSSSSKSSRRVHQHHHRYPEEDDDTEDDSESSAIPQTVMVGSSFYYHMQKRFREKADTLKETLETGVHPTEDGEEEASQDRLLDLNHHRRHHAYDDVPEEDEIESNLSPFVQTLLGLGAGAAAGAVAKTTIAPLERVKIIFQVGDKPFSPLGVFRTVRDTYVNEGFRALYKGNGANMVRIMPYAALQFVSHEKYKQFLLRDNEDFLPPLRRFVAGAMAGTTATAMTYPLDLIRARLAIQHRSSVIMYGGLWDAGRQIVTGEGWRNLYGGLGATLIGIAPYAGISFFTFETLKHFIITSRRYGMAAALHIVTKSADDEAHPATRTWENKDQLASVSERDGSEDEQVVEEHHDPAGGICTHERLVCGAIAGLVGQSATYPLDVVRRRMQVASYLQREHMSMFRLAMHIVRTEGLRKGLYKGLSLNWVKGPIAVSVSFTTFDTLKRKLAEHGVHI
eukprot:Clim_evm126s147 gene=Clim_evmTU126s147